VVKITGTVETLSKIKDTSKSWILEVNSINRTSLQNIRLELIVPLHSYVAVGDSVAFEAIIKPLQATQ